MGIYIKGFEKKPCAECMFRGYDYCLLTDEYIGVDAEYKPEKCPLIEVKAPHGDLIDRDRAVDGAKVDGAWAALGYEQAVIEAEVE